MDNLVDNLAKLIIEQNTAGIGYDVAQDAIKSIDEEKNKRNNKENDKGGTVENVKEKTKRRRTTKTA